MHRSRLAGFIIDCRTDDLDAAAAFWADALGYPRIASKADEDAGYAPLDTKGGPHVEVQRVSHESRVHLDIETDDVDAEARRLEGLGARRIAKVRTWWVMEAPTGQRFCVVRERGGDFRQTANAWP